MNKKAPDPDIEGVDDTADDAVVVREHTRTPTRRPTGAGTSETRVRAALAIVVRTSRLLDEARNLEALAADLGDAALRKRFREYVTECDELLSACMKRVSSIVE